MARNTRNGENRGSRPIRDKFGSIDSRRVSSRLAPRALRPVPAGFTYLGLLFFVALIGIALAATGVVWHTESKRQRERELLFVGDQFRRAIGNYYERSPGGANSFPQSLDDLLLDSRYPNTQRYLRRVYADPMTGKTQWGLVKGPGDGIVGVYSLSEDKPLKTAGFKDVDADFEGKEKYSDWKFTYAPAAAAPPAAGTPGAPAPGMPGGMAPGMPGAMTPGTPGPMAPGMPGAMGPGMPGSPVPGMLGTTPPGT